MYERSTILVAEDTAEDVLLLRIAFEKAGINASLQVVRDGQEAISYLSGTTPYEDRRRYPVPQLFLLDLKMPVLDGFQVLAWLREQPELLTLPVVALSSSILPEDIQRVFELGANAYVEKPVGLHRLIEASRAIGTFWLGHNCRLSLTHRSRSRVPK